MISCDYRVRERLHAYIKMVLKSASPTNVLNMDLFQLYISPQAFFVLATPKNSDAWVIDLCNDVDRCLLTQKSHAQTLIQAAK